MKKTFTIMFASTAALALAACAGEAEEGYGEEEETMAEETMEAEEPVEATEAAEEGEDGLDGTGNPIGPAAADGEGDMEAEAGE